MMFYRMMRRNATRIAGDRSSTLALAHGRLLVISSFFILIYAALAIRAFDLSVLQGDFWHAEQEETDLASASTLPSEASLGVVKRGRILDRNGELLASSLRMASLYADPQLIAEPEDAARQLVAIFPELSYGKLLRDLQSDRRFVWIERNILPSEQEKIMEIGEPGLNFQYEDKRVYPSRNEMVHLVGFTDIDGQGISGIERSFNSLLEKGKDVHLSLDMRVQHLLHRELANAVDDFSAIGGAGVILDVKSGEVLAGVSLPDFNPHDAGAAKATARFNRLSVGVYELGSVFKIFSTAAFLEHNHVPMSTTFDVRESIKVGGFEISDYHAEKRILTLPEVFMHSSNIGSAMMGQALGGEVLEAFYRDLGLLNPLDIEIAETARPLTPDRWGEVQTMTASYGHGIAVSPLQAASAVASIVNGGYLISPHLVMDDDAENSKKTIRPVQIVSEETSYKMRELMRLTVTDGTGGNADVPGYRIGGKTGTAEKAVAGGYDHHKRISSFAAVFPVDAPRYVIFVAVDEPKASKDSFGYATAGWVAAPIVKRVVSSMASILDLRPSYDGPGYEHPLKQYVAIKG